MKREGLNKIKNRKKLWDMFGWGYRAKIKDIAVLDVNIVGGEDTGALLGHNGFGRATITGCCSSGVVQGRDDVGGLVGIGIYLSINDSYSLCNVSGNSRIGGLVGRFRWDPSIITNCYSTGLVSGNKHLVQ